jgi:hypothetical protein
MARRRALLGEVTLLGLNEFGQNPGLNPIYGTLIGGGVGAITSMAVARTARAADKELYGFLAGLGASGVMYAMKGTRHAALGGAVGAFLTSGLAWIEKKLAPAAVATAAAKTVEGLGRAQVSYLNGLGVPQVNYLNGLGMASIAPQPPAIGTIPGVAGPAFAGTQMGGGHPPVSLLGAPTTQSQKVSLMGGPPVHGLSASYGATLLGGGRS